MELLSGLSSVPFYLLATAAVVCSLSMVFNSNLIRAGFTLIGAFVSIAGIYFLLSANFVAVSQILIYAVGIVLVIIFAVMLCNLRETAGAVGSDEDLREFDARKWLAGILSIVTFALLVYVINSQDWGVIAKLTMATAHTEIIPEVSKQYTEQIGSQMLGSYILPFELVSVLLLVVLVGSIILSKKKINT